MKASSCCYKNIQLLKIPKKNADISEKEADASTEGILTQLLVYVRLLFAYDLPCMYIVQYVHICDMYCMCLAVYRGQWVTQIYVQYMLYTPSFECQF